MAAEERKFDPSKNIEGETCCCFIEIRVAVIMISIITIIAAVSQYFYEDHGADIWWLWTYCGLSALAATIGIASACLYKPILAKIYTVWLIISCVIWIVDGILFSSDTLGFVVTIAILIVKIYFVYILWKFSKLISIPYSHLGSI